MKSTKLAAALLVLSSAAIAEPAVSGKAEVAALIERYHAAMKARSVERLGELVEPDLTVLEGSHLNTSWTDYRDNHIGPEMRDWTAYAVDGRKLSRISVASNSAFVVEQATYTITTAGETIVLDGAQTFVARRSKTGWRLAHLHFSGKRRKPDESKPAESKP